MRNTEIQTVVFSKAIVPSMEAFPVGQQPDQKFDTPFMTVVANTVTLNIIY